MTPPRRVRAMRAVLAAGMLLAAAGARANDLGLTVGPIERSDGAVIVSYRAETPFTPRLEETLLRGMPATVTFEVGVWKKRALWFDKLVLAIKSEHKVVYDPWERKFRVRAGPIARKTRTVPSIDSLAVYLFSERRLPLLPLDALDPDARYYVSVRATIRPLTAEDLGEVEDWLSGEVKNPSAPARGLPGYLLGIAVNISGLGDRTGLAKSEPFRTPFLEMPQ